MRTQHPRPKPPATRRGGRGSAAIPPQVSSSTKIRQECLWLRSLDGATVVASTRRHQRWTTRHPIRFQECADRRPLLQQSRSDLRFPGPPADYPMRRPRCPRVHGSRSHGCHGPRCRLPQLRSPTHLFDHHDHEKLTLLDGRRMVAALEPRAGAAPSPIPARWAPVASAPTRPEPHGITTHPSRPPASTEAGDREGTVPPKLDPQWIGLFHGHRHDLVMTKSWRWRLGPPANHYGA